MWIPLLAAALVLGGAAAAGPAEGERVRVVANVDYLPDADYADQKDKLDLYLPEGRHRFPVILSIHGGGLLAGDKSRTEQVGVGRRFASAGIGTAVVNYRLSPRVTHPAHAQDVAAALAWVKRHIAEYGGDPDALFVIGHSAGAYLAALLALDERYLAAHGLTPRGIRGAVPVSGFFYVERVAPDRPQSVWGTDPTKWPEASAARYLKADAPAILLLYAEGDEEWRRQQNEEMAVALKQTGHTDVTVKRVNGRNHGTIWSRIAPGDEVSTLILDFISRRLAADRGAEVVLPTSSPAR